MGDQSDDQLLQELEEIAQGMDVQDSPDMAAEGGSEDGATVPHAERGQGSPGNVGKQEESIEETPNPQTNENDAKKATPAARTKKRGLNMVKKSGTPEPVSKPTEQPPKKKIAARIVKATPDETAQEPDESSVQTAETEAADIPSKAAAKKAPKKAGKAENARLPVKRAKNAFMFFSSDKRAALKAENPGLSMGDTSKKLGELWKEASAEEKKKYEAMAEKDKDRAAAERSQVKGPAAAARSPQKPRAKTAYQLFCDEERPKMKEVHPEAKFGELNALLAAKWKEASNADKEPFHNAYQELKAQLPAPDKSKPKGSKAAQQDQAAEHAKSLPDGRSQSGSAEDIKPHSSSPKKVFPAVSKQPSKTSLQQNPKARVGNTTDDGHLPEAGAAEDNTMVAEMMSVDWEANPAEYIMAETADAKYLVKRKGLDFTDCGMVDARVAKRQRLQQPGQDEASQSPVSIAMVEEWESFQKSFRCAVHAHNDGGELDLDDLNRGSPLEMCSFLVGILTADCLGIMKEPDFPLHKAGKGQPTIKVPMLELSKAVQRVIDVERKACEELQKELTASTAALAAKEDTLQSLKNKDSATAGGLEE